MDRLKELEEELSAMECRESQGYIKYFDSTGGGFISVSIASPGQVTYHFARKSELRVLIEREIERERASYEDRFLKV